MKTVINNDFPALPGIGRVEWVARPDTRHIVNLKSCELQFEAAAALVADAMTALTPRDLQCYPCSLSLRLELCRYWQIDADSLALTAGSSTAIAAIVDAFAAPAGRLIIQEPAFGAWTHHSTVRDIQVHRCPGVTGSPPRTWVDPFADALSSAPARAVAAITNPTNPLGDRIELSDMRRLADIASRRGHLLVIDDCYGDFDDSSNHVSLTHEYPNVLVIRSLSKSWGLAGARLGAVVGNPALIEIINRLLGDNALSGPGLVIATEMARRPERLSALWSLVRTTRDWFSGAVVAHQPGWTALPSSTNFVTFATPHRHGGEAVTSYLAQHRIRVRSCDDMAGLDGCVRIAMADRATLAPVLTLLKTFKNSAGDIRPNA